MPNKETHKFWSTQPVKNDGEGEVTELKENNKQLQLPAGFTFETLTFDDLDSIYELLKDSYVEDLSQNFRLLYSKEMLKWQFQNLSHKSEYLLGVKKDNKLYGFTFAKEHLMNINGHEVRMVSINFLCVVRMLRNRRLAPLIIREITRRAVSHGIQQAVFTGGIVLPFMYSQAPYYHRMINMQKLIKLEYCGENSRTNQMKFDDWKLREGTREMEERDYKQVMDLYNKKCKGYSIYEILDEKEFAYQFTMRKDLLYTLVYEENGEIKEYGSFFLLDTLCTNNQAIIKTAYIYYHYSSDRNDMIKDLLAYAKSIGCDLLNALNVMDNHKFFDELDFEEGTGSLKYYLYNWNSPPVDSNQIHLVLP